MSNTGSIPAKVLYAPRGQAGEYAPLAINPYRGCGHGCKYCYVPKVLFMGRADFDRAAIPRARFAEALDKEASKMPADSPQVMLSFTTDPYHPFDTSLTRESLSILRNRGLSFCTLTKGGTRALRDIDLFRPAHDAFASTLTSLDDDFSRRWEPGAALPSDRIAALKTFHAAGVFTWVSLEPTIDVEASLAIIEATHTFVDLYKVGRVNYLPITKTTDWKDYTHRVIALLGKLGTKHYIKHDLQPYLPAGYHNPLRIPQHN